MNTIKERMRSLIERSRIEGGHINPALIQALEYHPLHEIQDSGVDFYVKKLKNHESIEPVVLVGTHNYLIDGRHRVEAAKKLGQWIPFIKISDQQFEAYTQHIPMLSLEQIANKVRDQHHARLAYSDESS